jgi:dTDP-4-dehydrorhamnose reductase
MTRRMLITGGAGYLGAELAHQANAQGWHVTTTVFRQPAAHPTIPQIPLDIRDAAAVERAFQEVQPNVVVHTAYRQNGPDLWSTCATGAAVVARAARDVNARLIHLSSDAIFDGTREGAYTEDDPPSPITPYGEAKAAAEGMVAEILPTSVIVRTSLLYGGSRLGTHEQLILDVADGRADLTFFTDEIRCPITVDDLAAALLEVANLDYSGILHIAGPEPISRYDFARLIAAAHGRSPEVLRAGLSSESGLRRPRHCTLDISRAQRLLHTRLRGVSDVLGASIG